MNGKVEKGKFYRLDELYYKSSEYTWLERIEFEDGEVKYTEDYVQVPTSEVGLMILEGTILENY